MASITHIFLESVEKTAAIRTLDHFREFEAYLDEDGILDCRALVLDSLVDVDATYEEAGQMLGSVVREVAEKAVNGMYLPANGGQQVDDEMASHIVDTVFGPFGSGPSIAEAALKSTNPGSTGLLG